MKFKSHVEHGRAILTINYTARNHVSRDTRGTSRDLSWNFILFSHFFLFFFFSCASLPFVRERVHSYVVRPTDFVDREILPCPIWFGRPRTTAAAAAADIALLNSRIKSFARTRTPVAARRDSCASRARRKAILTYRDRTGLQARSCL